MTRPHPALVAAALAATYGYFLIFAEFAFIELVRTGAGSQALLRPIMAALAAGGVTGSLLAAWRHDPGRCGRALAAGFGGCAAGAVGATLVPAAAYGGVALLIGLSLGWLTVTLAGNLRSLLGGARLGLWIGLGTGGAYAWSNLPWVFTAAPKVQALAAAGLAVIGAALAWRWRADDLPRPEAREYQGPGRVAWITLLLGLVWLDSAAFYVIQHTAGLRNATWGGPWLLYGNALMHLVAALAAGMLIDRGRMAQVTVAAFGLLLAGCWQLGHGPATGVAVVYTAAVSLYSVALVYYPAQGGRPWLVAAVYALAGWMGSALGVGMAQDLQTVPGWFLAVSAVLFAAAWWRAHGGGRILAAGLAAGWILIPGGEAAEADLIARGREVYVSEGCLHCHSQYVRPGPADEERWGPAMPLAAALAASPPLLGNRRQGPDLSNLGARRSPEWNRLHLIEPRTVNPGSRMPAYAHLFAGNQAPGEALVAYLATLGEDNGPAMWAAQANWRPAAAPGTPPVAPRRLYLRLCAGCHGSEGRGDGPLAARLGGPPPDFQRDAWRRVDPAAGDLPVALARVIKFGVPGTAMAGHEYLDDATVVSLAHYVQGLHRAGSSP